MLEGEDSIIHKVTLRSQTFQVDLTGDYYGKEYWNKISERLYEPDTVGFLENRCDSDTQFFDIGAANGAMSFIAALKGAEVLAYDPDPTIYQVAKRNFELNPSLSSSIQLRNIALSSTRGRTIFGSSADSTVLSSIVTAGRTNTPTKEIVIESLVDEINRNHSDKNRKLILKMDIEGAEWRIIQNVDCLETLEAHNALLLLAVHPGFYRPFIKFKFPINSIRYRIWQFRNFRESVSAFNAISRNAKVMRTNLNPVNRSVVFAILIAAGYHEFIVDFRS